MKHKKTQMEIMGLAIVVILVSLGFLFVLKFNVLKKPAETHKDFIQSEMASNFLNSLLRTTSKDCYDLSFTEIFQDCGKESLFTCENGKDTCNYIKDQTQELLSKTLDQWSIQYGFTAYVNPNNPLVDLGLGCPGQKISKFFQLPLTTSTMVIRMDIC